MNDERQRVIAKEGVTTTVFVGDYFEYNVTASEITKYYFAGGVRLAMQRGSSGVKFILGDHLGSASVVLNADGTFSGAQGYYPWGEINFTEGTIDTEYTFTGQYNYSDFGLAYYNSRWYDNSIGRFAQADTIIPDPYNSLDYDRYQYVRSNSTNFIDPTGHWAEYCPDPYDEACAETTEELYSVWVAKGLVDPLPEDFEVPVEFPSKIEDPKLVEAWIWLWNSSPEGKRLAKFILDYDIRVEWGEKNSSNRTCSPVNHNYCFRGSSFKITIQKGAKSLPGAFIAPILAHEAYHATLPYGPAPDSLYEEFMAYELESRIRAAINQWTYPYMQQQYESFEGYNPLNINDLQAWFMIYHPVTYSKLMPYPPHTGFYWHGR
jgi:RHS repeat-associated protein